MPVLPGRTRFDWTDLDNLHWRFQRWPVRPPAHVFGVQWALNPIDVSVGQTVWGADFTSSVDMPRFDRFEDGIVRNGFRHAESLLSRFLSWLDRRRVA